MTQRYKLTLEYDGTSFSGWQIQENQPTIQLKLEQAIEHFCQTECPTIAAGRTDAGVHAKGQVVHVDLPKNYPCYTVQDALNYYLKKTSISVLNVKKVSNEFHARFSAKRRVYLYRILNRRAPCSLDENRLWWIPTPLDVQTIDQAGKVLIGKHDFTTFRASECQAKSPIKTLETLTVKKRKMKS